MSAASPPVRWDTVLSDGRRASLLARSSAINLLLNDEEPSFTFDLAGRLHGAFYEGRNYRRSLDNRVLAKWSVGEPGNSQRQRRWLPATDARALVQAAYSFIAQAAQTATERPPAIAAALTALRRWDWDALEADRLAFQQIYTPIGILPPDQYLALVLQATHGCSHNACTFCTFYQDVRFRIKSPEEFRQHIAGVLNFFGAAAAMRRSIFLADANALVAPMTRLLPLLAVLESAAQAQALASLPWFAFIDAFHVERKSIADWQELRARGLARVYIGMESGHDPLLRWLNKPGDAADVLDAVTTLKAAGLQASVIVMLGVGGAHFAAAHLRDTAALLNAMPLGQGDIIYLSDFVDQPTAPYAALAAAQGILPLTQPALREQEAALRALFRAHNPSQPPQFSRYHIEEFVY
ncbi:MAG: radical SAM protein [Anaerolineae bacterium]